MQSKLRYPDFICIGAQKAGTTWLYHILLQHKAVWLPQVKEMQYFNQLYIESHRKWIPEHRDQHAARSLAALVAKLEGKWKVDWKKVDELLHLSGNAVSDEWYGRIFGFADADRVAGEITPEYALLPEEAIRHIVRLNGKVKIIFSVRDPIDRAWSHMRMLISGKDPKPNDAAMVALSRQEDVIGRSDYTKTIDRWSQVAPAQPFLLINYDDIGRSPRMVLDSVCGFLGISAQAFPDNVLSQRIHEGAEMQLPDAVYQSLKKRLKPLYDDPPAQLAGAYAVWRKKHYAEP